jgi:hypothetical protein
VRGVQKSSENAELPTLTMTQKLLRVFSCRGSSEVIVVFEYGVEECREDSGEVSWVAIRDHSRHVKNNIRHVMEVECDYRVRLCHDRYHLIDHYSGAQLSVTEHSRQIGVLSASARYAFKPTFHFSVAVDIDCTTWFSTRVCMYVSKYVSK